MVLAFRDRDNPSTVLVIAPGFGAIGVDGSWKPSAITGAGLEDFTLIKDPAERYRKNLPPQTQMYLPEGPGAPDSEC
jgi:hypothetical protein